MESGGTLIARRLDFSKKSESNNRELSPMKFLRKMASSSGAGLL